MHWSHRASPAPTVLVILFVCMGGCSPPSSEVAPERGEAEGGATPTERYLETDLDIGIGQYMPPLEGGALEIAAPENWDWARASGDYLVGFVPRGSELNNLPRILVSSEECPYPDIRRVAEDNVREFSRDVSASLAGQEIAELPRPLILGNNAFVCYTTFAKRKNAVVSCQVLETVAAGCRYIVRLEAYEQQFDKYRDAAYAVSMSMKFGLDDDSPSSEVGEPVDPHPEAEARE